MNPADDLLDQLSVDPGAPDRVRAQFGEWWRSQDDRALGVLDQLALRAAHEPVALDLLLGVIDQHGIARPALRRFVIDGEDLDDAERATLAVVRSRIEEYAGVSRFTTWLHQVAANEARSRMPVREHGSRSPDG